MKKIKGFYGITIDGKIWSTKTKKWLKWNISKGGYARVKMNKKLYLVHRLVWEAYKGDIPAKMQINHLDENKLNNDISNLEICDVKYNINYGTRTERAAKSRVGQKRSPESCKKMSEAAKKRMKKSPARDENGRFIKKVLA
jgi:hypothetical protein